MRKIMIRYWICQIIGWGGWSALNLFFVYLFAGDYYLQSPDRKRLFFASLFIQFAWYVLGTHLLRLVLKKIRWINMPIDRVIGLFIGGVIITGLLTYYGAKTTAVGTGNSLVQYEKREDLKTAIQREKDRGLAGTDYYLAKKDNPQDSVNYAAFQRLKRGTGWYRNESGTWTYEDQRKGRFWWDIIFNFILIALWLLIYMVWHYLVRNQKDEVDKLNLEKAVKELELKTIKSHINPHFIFNSLNSIRALVEENPARARSAITELSNILRSSLQIEKLETVKLEQELNIVKDYLALEQMRFEERLRVRWAVDEKSLKKPVPPMMVQTLVENAIKHGISRQITGGTVFISTKIENGTFSIFVENTGQLDTDGVEGFGFKSTRDRLKILYGGRAEFSVNQIEENKVQARVVIPVNT